MNEWKIYLMKIYKNIEPLLVCGYALCEGPQPILVNHEKELEIR